MDGHAACFSPLGLMEAFKVGYPKLLLLAGTYIVVFLLIALGFFEQVRGILSGLGYSGVFTGGFLHAQSFTDASATMILLFMSREYDFLLSGLAVGLGALLGDVIIFLYVRHGLTEEVEAFSSLGPFQSLKNRVSIRVRNIVFPIVAGLLIASPRPQK